MKHTIILCSILLFMSSCIGRNAHREDSASGIVIEPDSITVDNVEETDTLILVDEEVPASADESFADFFYNFLTEETFQQSRIIFPISCYYHHKIDHISKEDWQFDPMFSNEESYSIIYDRLEDMSAEKESDVSSVQVDYIFIDKSLVRRYYFEKIQDKWKLEAINTDSLQRGGEEDFFTFYDRFSTDSLFQSERLSKSVSFITTDPEDDFNILETTIDAVQWFSFRPPMMQHTLTNIHYGQNNTTESSSKILELKGFGNGLCNVLYFERHNNKWILMKFEDLSD